MTRSGGIALIAGAGDGIGVALARRCLSDGFVVNVVARSLERLESRMAPLEAPADRLVCHETDLRSEAAITALFDRVQREHGAPDLVVFNAGAQYRKPFAETPAEMFEKVWRLSCYAGFLVGQAAARAMLARGQGTIIFTGATASLRGGSQFAAFAAAKFGLRAVAQSMAREFGPRGLHVASVIVDGAIDMPRIHQLFPNLAATTPPDGLLDPSAIADAYLALHRQQRSAWSHEVDLRPWCEKF